MNPVDRFFPEGWDCAEDGNGFWIKRPDGALMKVRCHEDIYVTRDGEEMPIDHRCHLDECDWAWFQNRYMTQARCTECGARKEIPWVRTPEIHAMWAEAARRWSR